jgi:hypothetical protein
MKEYFPPRSTSAVKSEGPLPRGDFILSDGARGDYGLYNLKDDPYKEKNLAARCVKGKRNFYNTANSKGIHCRLRRIKKEPADDGSGRLDRTLFIYVELRLLNVRTTFVPVTLLVPLVDVNSPVSLES